MPLTSAPTTTRMYKGKVTRSWEQLPPEVIRLVATYFLLDLSVSGYVPRSWDDARLWPNRMVYVVLRDAMQLERLMKVCPTWGTALESHLFWQRACATVDPQDALARHAVQYPSPKAASAAAAAPVYLTPYTHLRNMLSCTCHVCRINRPYGPSGLLDAKRTARAVYLGAIATCREHRKGTTWCGLCLRDAPSVENVPAFHAVGCVDNEDQDTWPGVDATCRACRSETLWRRVANSPRERAAVGGHRFEPEDWEARQAVDAFLDLGEGTIKDVLALALEKQWLRAHTKIAEISGQAMAASRLQAREAAAHHGAGYASEDDELSDDEDDPELIALTEDAAGVKDLALNDWIRLRILDGHWLSPADQWYRNVVPDKPTSVPAEHPCPWVTHGNNYDDRLAHPADATLEVECPPTFTLCEHAYRAYQKQMKLILLPAMANVVRRLVIECAADGVDPALKASKMTLEDVNAELRGDAVWYKGFDWLEVRANRRRQARLERREDEESDSSDTTSPVLSTSTLQTTPSPPPKDGKPSPTLVIPIPVQPVLETPVLIHAIPHVPETLSHLPYYSSITLHNLWREACSPLYHCRCSICERAMLRANGGAAAVQAQAPPLPARQTSQVRALNAEVPREIVLREEEEESEAGPDAQLILLESFQEEEELAIIDLTGDSPDEDEAAEGDLQDVTPVTPRKRRSNDLRSDAVPDEEEPVDVQREGTPAKRARWGTPAHVREKNAPTSPRLRKRTPEDFVDRDASAIERHRKRTSQELGSEDTTASEDEPELPSGRNTQKRQRITPSAGEGKLRVVDGTSDPFAAPRTAGNPPHTAAGDVSSHGLPAAIAVGRDVNA